MRRYFGLCLFSSILLLVSLSTNAFAESYCLEEVKGRAASCTKELSNEVATSGVYLLLVVLTALASLIALRIVLPKAVAFIKRFL